MHSFCYFYIYVKKKFTSFVLLYKGVVGFLPAPTCKTSTFFKSLSMVKNLLYLEHNHIKEQETALYQIY